MDPLLFGGFISVICSFAKEAGKDELKNISVTDRQFFFKHELKLIFAAEASSHRSSKRIKDELNSISAIFFRIYDSEAIKNWNYDLDYFSSFKNEIQSITNNDVKDFLIALNP